MNPRVLLAACFASLLLVGCTAQPVRESAATSESPTYSIERHREQRKVEDGVTLLVIDNPYGEIQVRQTRASTLAFQAVEQHIGEKPRAAIFDWFHEGEQQGVRVRYAEHDPSTPANPREGRVDLVAFVPSGIAVQLRTDFGDMIVRRINNDVTASSRSGRVTVTARGVLNLSSETGEVRAWNMGYDWPRPSELRSGGIVMVDVPVFTGLDLEVSARDEIRAEFELDHLSQDEDGVWHARHRQGDGASVIRVTSGASVLLQAQREPLPASR